MLEEVQMSVTLSHRNVHELLAVRPIPQSGCPQQEVHPNRERAPA